MTGFRVLHAWCPSRDADHQKRPLRRSRSLAGAQGPPPLGRLQGLGVPGWQAASATGRARSPCTRTRRQGGDDAAHRAGAHGLGTSALGGEGQRAGRVPPSRPVTWLTSDGLQQLSLRQGQVDLSHRGGRRRWAPRTAPGCSARTGTLHCVWSGNHAFTARRPFKQAPSLPGTDKAPGQMPQGPRGPASRQRLRREENLPCGQRVPSRGSAGQLLPDAARVTLTTVCFLRAKHCAQCLTRNHTFSLCQTFVRCVPPHFTREQRSHAAVGPRTLRPPGAEPGPPVRRPGRPDPRLRRVQSLLCRQAVPMRVQVAA